MGKRAIDLDVIKILACFLVIVNHTSTYLIQYGQYTKLNVFFYSFSFMFCKIAVPLFIMVSGSLLLSRQDSFQKIMKRIMKVMVPLVLLSIVAYVYKYGLDALPGFGLTFLRDPILVPFWYLYLLVGLYLMSPFVAKMVLNMNDHDHRVFILLVLIVPGTVSLLGLIFGFSISKYLMGAFVPYVIGYFVAGHYFRKTELRQNQLLMVWGTLIVSLTAETAAMYLVSMDQGNPAYFLDNITMINTVLVSLCVFILIRYYTSKIHLSGVVIERIGKLSELTWGIYLVHVFIYPRIARFSLIIKVFSFNSIIGLLMLEFSVMVISGLIVWGLKKVPLVRSYL